MKHGMKLRPVTKMTGMLWTARIFVIAFYLTGLAGLLFPGTIQMFKGSISFALLSSVFILVLFHQGKNHAKPAFFFLVIILAGFFIEVAGVHTGAIFGEYRYGESLGLKWLGVPLIIGMNWAMLTYMTASLSDRLPLGVCGKVVTASLLMTGYDLVLEQSAPDLNMWYWDSDRIPPLNYLSWFLMALAFQSLLKIFRIETGNKMSTLLLASQFLFFFFLFIFGTNPIPQ